ncbi:hypothetical protein TNCV_2867891 [Trichonephila clavipes]|nr:hypothetical protein TNCV_2867891 [Trichonephila clavipes]
MFSLEERIATISWKLDGKTYEDDCQQYQRKYRKQIPTGANIRLLVNKFRRIGSVADEKLPGRPLTSDDAFKRLYLNSLTSSLVVAVFRLTAKITIHFH